MRFELAKQYLTQLMGWDDIEARNELQDVDLMAMLDFEDTELIPAMEAYNYHVAVKPFDLAA